MGNYDLVRKPMDYFTGVSPEKCTYALFPGYGICGYEPDIIVKLYDSLLFQHPDTGMFIQDYSSEEVTRKNWESLGKPTLLMACPRLLKYFQDNYPDIPVDSLYEVLIDLGISGGCNKETYALHAPEDIPADFLEAVKSMAEDMGVDFVDEAPGVPYITCSMADRNALKREGKDAAHILELIYGMGDSNTHLIHEDHDHDHEDCDGDCSTCSLAVDCEMEAGGQKVEIELPSKAAPSELPDDAQVEANRAELIEALDALFWTPQV